MTKITISDSYGSCTIELNEEDYDALQILSGLVIPCMLGKGYQQESILEAMEEIYYVEKSSREFHEKLQGIISDPDGKNSTQPDWVCLSCGCYYGLNVPEGDRASGATWHEGECGVCGKVTSVTEPRDFGYLMDSWASRPKNQYTSDEEDGNASP